jgi:GNAT superfamily N-acetyltransferase
MPEIAAHPPTGQSELREGLAAGLLWVALDPALGVVAFALAQRLAGSLHLAELSVLPSHGRRGLGAALVQRVAGAAGELGCSRLTLSTFTRVPWNGPFYERLGFRTIAAADLEPELLSVRRAEAAAGLPVDERAIMSLALEGP